MKKSGLTPIAARYVHALFDVAESAHATSSVEADMLTLLDVFSDETMLAQLSAPVYAGAKLDGVIRAIGKNLHPLTLKALELLAQNKRLTLLPLVAEQFARQARHQRGEQEALVCSAQPLSVEAQKLVEMQLGATLGKKIVIHATVDPKLIGGLVVTIGSQQLDATLSGKLRQLEHTLKAA